MEQPNAEQKNALQTLINQLQQSDNPSRQQLGQITNDLIQFASDASRFPEQINFSNAPAGTDADDAPPLRTLNYDWQKLEKLFDLLTIAALIKQIRQDADKIEDAQEKLKGS